MSNASFYMKRGGGAGIRPLTAFKLLLVLMESV